MNDLFTKNFLTNTDESGRFIVTSYRTGKRYFVEPMMARDTPRDGNWGSINPGAKELMHKKGDGKYTGAVTEDESMISLENGFEHIHYAGVGTSPYGFIEMLDAKYPSIARQ
jgi:hypothetical protein